MFERIINKIITEGIEDLTTGSASQATLRRLLAMPGWEPEEIEKMIEFWNGEGRPVVVHGYAREVTTFPCYAIVLASESESEQYIGRDAGQLKQAQELVAEIEADLGHPVDAKIRRFSLSYNIFVYTEHPDITLAYYNVLRTIMFAADHELEAACFEDPEYKGNDLIPAQNYLPTNLYTRQLTVSGQAHTLYFGDLTLGPLALGRGKSVARIHVANHVEGVDPGVTVPGQGG